MSSGGGTSTVVDEHWFDYFIGTNISGDRDSAFPIGAVAAALRQQSSGYTSPGVYESGAYNPYGMTRARLEQDVGHYDPDSDLTEIITRVKNVANAVDGFSTLDAYGAIVNKVQAMLSTLTGSEFADPSTIEEYSPTEGDMFLATDVGDFAVPSGETLYDMGTDPTYDISSPDDETTDPTYSKELLQTLFTNIITDALSKATSAAEEAVTQGVAISTGTDLDTLVAEYDRIIALARARNINAFAGGYEMANSLGGGTTLGIGTAIIIAESAHDSANHQANAELQMYKDAIQIYNDVYKATFVSHLENQVKTYLQYRDNRHQYITGGEDKELRLITQRRDKRGEAIIQGEQRNLQEGLSMREVRSNQLIAGHERLLKEGMQQRDNRAKFVNTFEGAIRLLMQDLERIDRSYFAIADVYKYNLQFNTDYMEALQQDGDAYWSWLTDVFQRGANVLSAASGGAVGTTVKPIRGTGARIGSAAAGAAMGAQLGSVVPGVGTAVGMIGGGIAGALM